jgi:aspartyl-tRNA(Asn)/glutamyl-tRNA(Gln) amidotransferase subunit A
MAYAYEVKNHKRKIPAMPFTNDTLTKLPVAQLNQLYTTIGQNAYDKVLKNGKPEDLTPAVFKALVAEEVTKINTHK